MNSTARQAQRATNDKLRARRKSRARTAGGARPFTAGGNRNKVHKGLFSSYGYINDGGTRAKHMDRNGAPRSLHRGLTGMRHRSYEDGSVGSSAPKANQRMDLTTDHEWMPNPYKVLSHEELGRGKGSKKLSGAHSFKYGSSSQGNLFDPRVRPISLNYTQDPDWRSKMTAKNYRAKHNLAWSSASATKGPGDGFLSGHDNFEYVEDPFEPSERQRYCLTSSSLMGKTGVALGGIGVNGSAGYRAQDFAPHKTRKAYLGKGTSTRVMPRPKHHGSWKPSGNTDPLTSTHTHTDMHARFHSTQDPSGQCFHQCEYERETARDVPRSDYTLPATSLTRTNRYYG